MISLCMIVKDEELNLKTFLTNIKGHVDEIIIVDTGSKDNTKEIAKEFTNKIYDFKWNDNFSEARNKSIKHATKDWILILDPDEIITKENLKKIKNIIKNNEENTLGYRLIQETYHNNTLVSTRGICRLFKNNKGIKFIYPIHESVKPYIEKLNGKVEKTGVIIKNLTRYDKNKRYHYIRLIGKKIDYFPESNAKKELFNELNQKF